MTPDDVTTGVIVTPPPFSNTIGNLTDESCLLTFSMVAEVGRKNRQIVRLYFNLQNHRKNREIAYYT